MDSGLEAGCGVLVMVALVLLLGFVGCNVNKSEERSFALRCLASADSARTRAESLEVIVRDNGCKPYVLRGKARHD